MTELLVDTDVFSYLFRNDSRSEVYRPHLEGNRLFLAFQSLAELYRWAAERQWGHATRSRLHESLRKHYTILMPDVSTAEHWAQVMAHASGIGRSLAPMDAWIAAIALRHRLPLVTHNRNHFSSVNGLTLITERTD